MARPGPSSRTNPGRLPDYRLGLRSGRNPLASLLTWHLIRGDTQDPPDRCQHVGLISARLPLDAPDTPTNHGETEVPCAVRQTGDSEATPIRADDSERTTWSDRVTLESVRCRLFDVLDGCVESLFGSCVAHVLADVADCQYGPRAVVSLRLGSPVLGR